MRVSRSSPIDSKAVSDTNDGCTRGRVSEISLAGARLTVEETRGRLQMEQLPTVVLKGPFLRRERSGAGGGEEGGCGGHMRRGVVFTVDLVVVVVHAVLFERPLQQPR